LFRTVTRIALCTLLCMPGLPAAAASNICSFRAYSNDPDPDGTNVRTGPGTKSPIAGVLKATHNEEGDFSPEFDVLRFKDGWVEIGDAVSGQYGCGPEQTVFRGPGWVSAKLIAFEIEDPVLRDGPNLESASIADLGYTEDTPNPWRLDEVRVIAIHGCEGTFVDVTLANQSGQTIRGWATDLCENQATTCS
jgi:hypothetical protein